MDFLYCTPSVFVIGDEYEILVNTKQPSLIAVEIAGETYFEENAGALETEKSYAKIRVPQSVLDAARSYTVTARRTLHRKRYHSEMAPSESAAFSFRPLTKETDIRIYHMADIHYRFDLGQKLAAPIAGEIDLLILNGDFGEVENFGHCTAVAAFVGEISGGAIPVVFVRGNHDTRGRLAPFYPDYFPANGKETYFTFTAGPLRGIVLDCGEDKPDDHPEYGGVNAFEAFRRRETAWLSALPADGRFTFAVSHICPAQPDKTPGGAFDIEDALYRRWNDELARLGVRFMLCGHMHKAYILEKNDPASLRPHTYPAVVGSAAERVGDAWVLQGAYLTLADGFLTVRFTDTDGAVRGEHVIDLGTGRCTE